MDKGGGSSPSSQTVYQSNLPEYARPYFERLMSRTEGDSLQPYPTYGAPRLADFTGDQQAAFSGIRSMQQPSQLGWASDAAQSVGSYYNTGHTPANFSSNYTPGNLNQSYNPGSFTADYSPSSFSSSFAPPGSFNASHTPGSFSSERWPPNATEYMNPYISSVLSAEQDLANRRFQEQQRGRDTQAVNQGAFGGSRATIANEVARRGMNEQLDMRQRQALNDAYTTGIGAFQSDATRSLQAQDLYERSRQFGGTLGLQGYTASANAAAEAARLGLTADQLSDASRQYYGNLSLEAQRAGEQSRQFGGQYGIGSFSAQEGANERAAQLGLTAQQYDEMSRQYNSNIGLQAANTRLQAAQTGAGIGQLGQGLDLARYSALSGAGGQQQALNQRSMDIGYQDFLNQRDWDRNQLGYYGSLLRGIPVTPTTSASQYGGTGSAMQNLAGLGIAGYGMYRMMQ